MFFSPLKKTVVDVFSSPQAQKNEMSRLKLHGKSVQVSIIIINNNNKKRC